MANGFKGGDRLGEAVTFNLQMEDDNVNVQVLPPAKLSSVTALGLSPVFYLLHLNCGLCSDNMRARWVRHHDARLPSVASTLIGRWPPGSCYWVNTLEIRLSTDEDPMSRLLREVPGSDPSDRWVTQVFKCDRSGLPRMDDKPVYQREHFDIRQAKCAHDDVVRQLRDGQHMGAFQGFTEEEVTRLSWLRAVEWLAWPGFISQPIIPILYLFWPWYSVIAGVFLSNLAWLFVRYRFVSYRLATLGCLFVRLKWPVMIACSFYFVWHHEYWKTFLTVATPLIVMLLCGLFGGQIGTAQRLFLKELVFDPELQGSVESCGKGL